MLGRIVVLAALALCGAATPAPAQWPNVTLGQFIDAFNAKSQLAVAALIADTATIRVSDNNCNTQTKQQFLQGIASWFASTSAVDVYPQSRPIVTAHTGVIRLRETAFMTAAFGTPQEWQNNDVVLVVRTTADGRQLEQLDFMTRAVGAHNNNAAQIALLDQLFAAEQRGDANAYLALLSPAAVMEVHQGNTGVLTKFNHTALVANIKFTFGYQTSLQVLLDRSATFTTPCNVIVAVGQKQVVGLDNSTCVSHFVTGVFVDTATSKVTYIDRFADAKPWAACF